MRDHDEVYKRVIGEIERYEQRKRDRRTMLFTRVLPVAVAIAVIAAVGLYIAWRGRSGNGTGITPDNPARVTNIVQNPEGPTETTPPGIEPGETKPGYAGESEGPKCIDELNGYAFVADSQIRDDGKEAYAYTRLDSAEEGSYVGVSAEFYGIDRVTQEPVVVSASKVATEVSDGHYYGVVQYQVPVDSDVVIVRVVSDHSASDRGNVNWERVLTTEKESQGFNRRVPVPDGGANCVIEACDLPSAIRIVQGKDDRRKMS